MADNYKAKIQCKCGNDKFTGEVMRMNDNGTMIQELQFTCYGCGKQVRYFAGEKWFIKAQEVNNETNQNKK